MSIEESMYQKMARRIETLETQKSNAEYCFRELKKINEKLEQELAEAKKDQARYQWLRDQNNFRGDLYPFVYNDFFDKSYFFEELDSIVDAAIKERSK